ncbi:MAG TPA: hypothetical protein VE135_07305 [Pyrinomonadaceae bacterium]|nr:hypothetical protein [Pyrinomonadaceae bacterium]
MPVIEPVITEEKLRQLLDEQHESGSLDYKAQLSLDDTRSLVEFAKDVGAMQVDGGFIVIGADNGGNPTGRVTARHAKLFDEATVRPKLLRYLPEPLEVRCAQHSISGQLLVLFYVGPNPDGFCIFKADGNYPGGTAFRAGEVFARHGTSSEPWRQSDIKKVFERRLAAAKEDWRRELAMSLEHTALGSKAQTLSRAPAAALTWQLDEKTFISIITEQLRNGDTIPLILLMNQLPADAKTLLTSNQETDFLTLLDRLACLGALFLSLDRSKEFSEVVKVLNRIYDIGLSDSGEGRSGLALKPSKLWLEVIRRVYALGALAVRRENWDAVRLLIVQRPRGLVVGEFYNNWLRHALTMASRSGDFQQQQNGRKVDLPLLSLCQQTALGNTCLSEDVDEDTLLDSLAQFDVFFNVVAISSQSRTLGSDYYPNFSRFYSRRSDPAFRRIIEDPTVRETLGIGNGEQLASSLRKLFKVAHEESFKYSGWDGVFDRSVNAFLDQYPQKNPE